MMNTQNMIADAVWRHFKQEVQFLQRFMQTNSVNGFLPGKSSPRQFTYLMKYTAEEHESSNKSSLDEMNVSPRQAIVRDRTRKDVVFHEVPTDSAYEPLSF